MNIIPSTLSSSNDNVATTRTIWNAFLVLYAVGFVTKYTSLDVDLGNLIVPAALAAVFGFFYRLSIVLARYPWFGVILFLINKNPGYAEPKPQNELEADAEPAPRDVGLAERDLLIVVTILVVIILAILVL